MSAPFEDVPDITPETADTVPVDVPAVASDSEAAGFEQPIRVVDAAANEQDESLHLTEPVERPDPATEETRGAEDLGETVVLHEVAVDTPPTAASAEPAADRADDTVEPDADVTPVTFKDATQADQNVSGMEPTGETALPPEGTRKQVKDTYAEQLEKARLADAEKAARGKEYRELRNERDRERRVYLESIRGGAHPDLEQQLRLDRLNHELDLRHHPRYTEEEKGNLAAYYQRREEAFRASLGHKEGEAAPESPRDEERGKMPEDPFSPEEDAAVGKLALQDAIKSDGGFDGLVAQFKDGDQGAVMDRYEALLKAATSPQDAVIRRAEAAADGQTQQERVDAQYQEMASNGSGDPDRIESMLWAAIICKTAFPGMAFRDIPKQVDE